MSQLSAAVTAMNSESHFVKGYSNGIKKSEFWEVYEKGMNSSLLYLYHAFLP